MADRAGKRESNLTDFWSPSGKAGPTDFSDTPPSSHGDTKDSPYVEFENEWATPEAKDRDSLLDSTIALPSSVGCAGVGSADSPMTDDDASSIIEMWVGTPVDKKPTQSEVKPVVKEEVAGKDQDAEDSKPAAKPKAAVKPEPPTLDTIEPTGEEQTYPVDIKKEWTAVEALVETTNQSAIKKAPNKRYLFSKHSSPSAAVASPKLKGAVVVADGNAGVAPTVNKATFSDKAVTFVGKDQGTILPKPTTSDDNKDGVAEPAKLTAVESTEESPTAAVTVDNCTLNKTTLTVVVEEPEDLSPTHMEDVQDAEKAEDEEVAELAPVAKVKPTAPVLKLDAAAAAATNTVTTTPTLLVSAVATVEFVRAPTELEATAACFKSAEVIQAPPPIVPADSATDGTELNDHGADTIFSANEHHLRTYLVGFSKSKDALAGLYKQNLALVHNVQSIIGTKDESTTSSIMQAMAEVKSLLAAPEVPTALEELEVWSKAAKKMEHFAVTLQKLVTEFEQKTNKSGVELLKAHDICAKKNFAAVQKLRNGVKEVGAPVVKVGAPVV